MPCAKRLHLFFPEVSGVDVSSTLWGAVLDDLQALTTEGPAAHGKGSGGGGEDDALSDLTAIKAPSKSEAAAGPKKTPKSKQTKPEPSGASGLAPVAGIPTIEDESTSSESEGEGGQLELKADIQGAHQHLQELAKAKAAVHKDHEDIGVHMDPGPDPELDDLAKAAASPGPSPGASSSSGAPPPPPPALPEHPLAKYDKYICVAHAKDRRRVLHPVTEQPIGELQPLDAWGLYNVAMQCKIKGHKKCSRSRGWKHTTGEPPECVDWCLTKWLHDGIDLKGKEEHMNLPRD